MYILIASSIFWLQTLFGKAFNLRSKIDNGPLPYKKCSLKLLITQNPIKERNYLVKLFTRKLTLVCTVISTTRSSTMKIVTLNPHPAFDVDKEK